MTARLIWLGNAPARSFFVQLGDDEQDRLIKWLWTHDTQFEDAQRGLVYVAAKKIVYLVKREDQPRLPAVSEFWSSGAAAEEGYPCLNLAEPAEAEAVEQAAQALDEFSEDELIPPDVAMGLAHQLTYGEGDDIVPLAIDSALPLARNLLRSIQVNQELMVSCQLKQQALDAAEALLLSRSQADRPDVQVQAVLNKIEASRGEGVAFDWLQSYSGLQNNLTILIHKVNAALAALRGWQRGEEDRLITTTYEALTDAVRPFGGEQDGS